VHGMKYGSSRPGRPETESDGDGRTGSVWPVPAAGS
jgi:hypothetical protein